MALGLQMGLWDDKVLFLKTNLEQIRKNTRTSWWMTWE